MKLPMVTKALGLLALAGAASASASTLVLGGSLEALAPNTGVDPGFVDPGANSVSFLPGTADANYDSAADPNFASVVHSTARLSGGTWTYSYQIIETGGPSPIQGLTIPLDFSIVSTALDQTTTPGLQTADYGTLNPGGTTIGFLWLSEPMTTVPGDTTSQWVSFTSPYPPILKPVGVQDGTVANANALVPVPEPATYAGLFALGLAGFAAFRRFRA